MVLFKLRLFHFGVGALLLAGCLGVESQQDGGDSASALRESGRKGKVRYVAVGNSLTSGFQNSGLREDWQEASYPALIAKAMGIGDF